MCFAYGSPKVTITCTPTLGKIVPDERNAEEKAASLARDCGDEVLLEDILRQL
jgi:hypothetical protein